MPYPISPFDDGFNIDCILNGVNHSDDTEFKNLKLHNIFKWLCTTPKITSFRVNTLTNEVEEVLNIIKNRVKQVSDAYNINAPEVKLHDTLKDTVIVHNWDITEGDLCKNTKEVIVDVRCGEAVLRGAHIFAPGVLGMVAGTKLSDEVSIYVDVARKCKKGLQKIYDQDKIFIGNGIAKMIRHELFKEEAPNGIAVEVTKTISGCPPLGDFLKNGVALLQNLSSIICTHVLNPQPKDTILDMCASPGNKTTHIAALMKNQGVLIALDKTPNKVSQLKKTCEIFSTKVHIFQADSTKILDLEFNPVSIINGPPFPRESFDRILLDAPCSALGKRPQLSNNASEKMLRSYVPLQRKLFETAIHLLKIHGTLVYSTCTVTTAENEGIVAWALNKFQCLELRTCHPHLGSSGLPFSGLTEDVCNKLQRFGPEDNVDSVGFFIACFVKNKV